jgi:hypothetical protein
MKRKSLMSLAGLLAVAALVVPAAAQAVPHYYSNGSINNAEPRTAIAWGTITLALTKPPSLVGTTITCHNAAAGTQLNPTGGAAGEGLTEVFTTFQCESELNCLAGESTHVDAENLPWTNKLTEEVVGTIRQETTKVKVKIFCEKEKVVSKSNNFVIGATEKGQRPKTVHGTSALHPGILEFGAGSGELEVEGSGNTVSGKTEGEVKTLGYLEQELLNVKNP